MQLLIGLVPLPNQNLQAIAAPRTAHEQMSTQRILADSNARK